MKINDRMDIVRAIFAEMSGGNGFTEKQDVSHLDSHIFPSCIFLRGTKS